MKIIGTEFNPKKMHIYDVKTKDEREFDSRSDMGWFWLNQIEYDYFKSQCKEIEL